MVKLAAIAAQVKSVCDLLHQYEGLETRQLRRMQTAGFHNAFAKSIIQGDAPQLAGYAFDLVHFRSISGSDLPSILPISRKILIQRKLRAFVGHRFNDSVTPNLRHNLAILFKAYGITPWYSDSDSPNGPVFSIILDRIRKSDFSVFDDRETETRPNTLIEIGAAIGLGRPYFLLQLCGQAHGADWRQAGKNQHGERSGRDALYAIPRVRRAAAGVCCPPASLPVRQALRKTWSNLGYAGGCGSVAT